MPKLTLVRGDKDFALELEVKDSEGEIVDITGCTVNFKMQRYDESTLTIDKVGTVTDGPAGVCQVLVEDEILTKHGEFIAELEIHWPSGKILTAPEISVKILKDLPR